MNRNLLIIGHFLIYLLIAVNNILAQESEILPTTTSGNFGYSIDASANYTLISSPSDNTFGSNAGIVSVFRNNGIDWVEEAQLFPNDSLTTIQNFGKALAIDGSYAVFGVEKANNKGAVYVFKRNGANWFQEAKLTPNTTSYGDNFGYSVAIQGNWIIVGSPYDNDSGTNAGAVYVFFKNATGWVQTQKLYPNYSNPIEYRFGSSLALDQNRLLVGRLKNELNNAPEAVYAFELENYVWGNRKVIFQNHATNGFGERMSISGDEALIAEEDSVNFYKYENSTWVKGNALLPDSTVIDQQFGKSVELTEDFAFVGGILENSNNAVFNSIYIYKRDATNLKKIGKIIRENQSPLFGSELTVSQGKILSNLVYGSKVLVWDINSEIFVDKNKINFGVASFGNPKVVTNKITNFSNQVLSLSSYNSTNSDFTIPNLPNFIQPDSSAEFEIWFTPSNPEIGESTLSISNPLSQDFVIETIGYSLGDLEKQVFAKGSEFMYVSPEFALSESENYLAVAAKDKNENNGVIILKNENNQWVKKEFVNSFPSDLFGKPIAISDSHLVTMSKINTGHLKLWYNDGTNWVEGQEINISSHETLISGNILYAVNYYGKKISRYLLAGTNATPIGEIDLGVKPHNLKVKNNYLVFGSPYEDSQKGIETGAVYVYQNSNGYFSLESKFTATDVEIYDRFGAFLDFDGNQIIVSTSSKLNSYQNKTYIFEKVEKSWKEITQFTPLKEYFNESNSERVAIKNNLAVIKYSFPSGGYLEGYIQTFRKTNNKWIAQTQISPSESNFAYYQSPVLTSNERLLTSRYIDNSYSYGIYEYGFPNAVLHTNELDFGYLNLGENKTKQITISNLGGTDFNFTNSSFSSIAFSGSIPSTIPANASSTFNINFLTGQVGENNSFLTLETNTGHNFVIKLLGKGKDSSIGFGEKKIIQQFGTGWSYEYPDFHFGKGFTFDNNLLFAYASGKFIVFRKNSNGGWTQFSTVYGYDGSSNNFYLNENISLNKNRVLTSGNGLNAGLAVIYKKKNTRLGNTWQFENKLVTNGDENIFSEQQLILKDSLAFVTAQSYDSLGVESGALYVFSQNDTSWIQTNKIVPSDLGNFAKFGYSMANYEEYFIVGAPQSTVNSLAYAGSAYIYKIVGDSLVQEAKLIASDSKIGSEFGYSVDILGDFAIVGSIFDNEKGNASGAAYIFQKIGNSWVEQTKITANDGMAWDKFGFKVKLSNNYALVSSRIDQPNVSTTGVVYLYKKVGNSWVENQKIFASDTDGNDKFGHSLKIDGDKLFVGAPNSTGMNNYASGSIYEFDLNLALPVEEFSENKNIIENFSLSPNYPNPFNPTTTIDYYLGNSNENFGKLTIFNVLGQRVKEFDLRKNKGSVVWNGTNEFGKQVSSGVYFYRLKTDNFTKTRKMLLLK